MATHTRRETIVRRIDHALPVPAVGAELFKTVAAASRDYCRITGYDERASLPDDALTITVTDDEVVISFTIEEPAR